MAAHPPSQTAFFIGRDVELSETAELLRDPLCRLLTLTGPGGIGKTRLAIEIAQRLDFSPDGWRFVPLQSLASHQDIVSTIAQGLNCPHAAGRDPFDSLVQFLRGKSFLLVVDSFEHVLDGAWLLSDLLARAPSVKILVTSRERLDLVEEWVYELGGLSLPASDLKPDAEESSAVRLFVLNARRVNRSFTLTSANKPVVSRICRLLDGMPLGIELAASWAHALPCATIADELQLSLDLLDSPIRNVLPRHRSMRAVIDSMWARLQPEERAVYAKLAVFRGGFSTEAAAEVAGATRSLLLSLIEKSLLRLDGSGQYSLHEVLRRYAEDQLAGSPESECKTRDLHARYYLTHLQEREQELVRSGAHAEAMARMLPELDDIRAAWGHGVRQGWLADLSSAIEGFWGFHCMRGTSREGAQLFGATAAALRLYDGTDSEAARRLTALSLAFQGLCTSYFDVEDARRLAQESLALLGEAPAGKPYFIAVQLSADVAATHADRLRWVEEALKLALTHDYGWWLPKNLIDLGDLASKLGKSDLAEKYYHDTLASRNRFRNPAAAANALEGLARLRLCQGDFAAARHLAEQALAIAYKVHYSAAWWWVQSGVADTALLQGDLTAAEHHYRQALQISREAEDRRGGAFCLSGLASVAIVRGDLSRAKAHLLEALEIAHELASPAVQLDALATGVNLLFASGSRQIALKLAGFVLVQDETEDLARAKLKPAASAQSEWPESIDGLTLDKAVQDLRQLLNAAVPAPAAPPVEALTKREIEVLNFIAEGLSNYDIAVRLFVGVSTVKTHINHILGKLDTKNRTQAIKRARELHLL